MTKVKDGFMIREPINRVILTIAIPLIINNLIRTLYNLTDGLFVAQISEVDFAATSFVWPINYVFISLGIGLGIGATSLISHFLGAGDEPRAKAYASNSMILSYVLGFVLALVGFLLTEFLVGLMGAEADLYTKSVSYLKISFIGLFFDFIFFTYQAVLTAQGMTRSITFISFISSITNIVLDPIFIFDRLPLIGIPGLGMGIAGAAWATVISKLVLFVLARHILRRDSKIRPRLNKESFNYSISNHIMTISLPSALGNGGSALGFTMLNSLIAAYGTTTLAAFSMVNRITDLFTQPQVGIGSAMTSIIGQNMGAKKYGRSKEIFSQAIKIISLVSLAGLIILILFRHQLLGLFISDKSNIRLWSEATQYLYFSAAIIFFMGFFSALNGFFQGTGQTKYAMAMNVGRLWALRLPLIWIFGSVTELGSTGIWISMLLSNMLICIYGFYIYKTRNWESLSKIGKN